MRKTLILVLLLGMIFIGRSFAGITDFDNVGLQSDSTIGLSYIAMFESVAETDTDFIQAVPGGDGSFSKTDARTVVGWIIIRYNPVTGYWELGFITTGVFNSVADYNALYAGGAYEGLDIFYSKQQVYDPNTGEIFVPVENQSIPSLH